MDLSANHGHRLRSPLPDPRRVRSNLNWYHKKTASGVVVIRVRFCRRIDYEDVVCLADSLVLKHVAPCVVINLAPVPVVSSGFLAGLLALKRRIDTAGGKLALCGAHGLVREALSHTHFDKLFAHFERESDAARACSACELPQREKQSGPNGAVGQSS